MKDHKEHPNILDPTAILRDDWETSLQCQYPEITYKQAEAVVEYLLDGGSWVGYNTKTNRPVIITDENSPPCVRCLKMVHYI